MIRDCFSIRCPLRNLAAKEYAKTMERRTAAQADLEWQLQIVEAESIPSWQDPAPVRKAKPGLFRRIWNALFSVPEVDPDTRRETLTW
jgi:hypothetical protein